MQNYIISACSTADLSLDHFKRRDIHYISYYFSLHGKEYIDDLGESMSYPAFYKKMALGIPSKTSQPNSEKFKQYFMKFLEEGKDIVHVSLSSALSGEFNSAQIARNELSKLYPDRTIIVVDSLAASGGYGMLMDTLADLRDEGKTLNELYTWVEENKLRLNHWFYTTDLSYYVRGGRLTKLSGFMGNLFNINPLLYVNEFGELIPRYKVVGKKRVQLKMLAVMKELIDNHFNYAGKIYIVHADVLDEAKTLETIIKKRYPNVKEVVINYVGTTIGAHTGPGTIAIFFFGVPRDEQ